MKDNQENRRNPFLSVQGEMAELTRKKDWSTTSLGAISTWAQSLKTLVSIILNSKFPMFLFWGQDLICFYNDAYRPSLGRDGKHPSILGMRAEDAWTDTWHIIKPLIDQVMNGGGATWSEDQLIPMFRNGQIEDVYWTFSYSPVNDDSDKIGGVLVTCSETTDKVITKFKLEESERRLRSMILQAPMAIGISRGENYLTEIANSRALELWGRTEEEVLNKPILEAMPELKSQRIKELLDNVYQTGKTYTANERPVLINRNGKIETTYINFSYEPLFNVNGKIDGIMASGIEVTEQVQARNKILESKTELQNLFKQAPVTIVVYKGVDHIVQVANTAALEMWGKSENDVLNKPFFEISPELKDSQGPLLAKVYQTGEPFFANEMLVQYNKKGSPYSGYFNFVYQPLRDSENEITGIIGIGTEVTEAVLNRQKIEASEKSFRLLADSMPQHIWTADSDGNLIYYNQSVFDYTGLSFPEIIKDGWKRFVHPDDLEKNIEKWNNAVATGKDYIFEQRFRKYDGEYRWQLSRAKPQRAEDGTIKMWVGTSTDIHEQVNFRAELEKEVKQRTAELVRLNESLKASEERYHLMVQEVQEYAILYINREGIVENWNAGAEKIKGYKAEEIIGKNFSNFYTDEDKKINLPQKLLNRALQSGKAVQEGWRKKKNGKLFWASVLITAVHNDKGEVIGFSKVTHDLTEKKNADDLMKLKSAELEQKNIELDKMNKELQSFAYISSHDLQEPLRKIQTFASRIVDKEKDNLSEQGNELFHRMQSSAERMQSLIDDLLAYSRTHTAEQSFKNVNLKTLIEDITQDLKEEIEQKKATIQTKNLCEIQVIPFQIQQVFYNLFGNSLKFSKPEQPLNITIECEIIKGNTLEIENIDANTTYCHIKFADNGIGFDQQYSAKIFKLFQRLFSRNEYNGTGIGLAIVKRIIDNHKGVITANGEEGKGATFDIYLPTKLPTHH